MGRAHALLLASRGCKVVVNDLGVKSTGMASDQDPATDVVKEIESKGGIATADRHNVVTEAAQIIETAISQYGRLDIVINNAGVLNDGLFSETPAAQWEAAFDVHLKGTVDVCRAAWPYLLQSDAARIVNTSSSATFGCLGLTSYCAAKGRLSVSREALLKKDGASASMSMQSCPPPGRG
jgi:NAD(P)-dependent dehydrogenase (short-subunit alcohol dehydrogenase family)